MKRTQIYLDEQQDARLAERARASGRTKSAIIRDAIEEKLATPAEEDAARLADFKAVLAATPAVGPHLDEAFHELRGNSLRRREELERRWRDE